MFLEFGCRPAIADFDHSCSVTATISKPRNEVDSVHIRGLDKSGIGRCIEMSISKESIQLFIRIFEEMLPKML